MLFFVFFPELKNNTGKKKIEDHVFYSADMAHVINMLPVPPPHALGHLLFPKPQGFWECLQDAKVCWAACEQDRQTLTNEGEDSGYKHPTSPALRGRTPRNFSG